MRLRRLGFIFLAIYLVFIGGSAYYTLVFPIRIFHHVLITLLMAVWLIRRIRRGEGLPKTPLNVPLYAVMAVWVLSALTSIDPRMAFENLWFQIIHVIMFFVLVDMLQRGRERLVLETQFMLAAAVIFLSGLELASWYFGLGIIPGTQIGWAQVVGPGAWLPITPIRLSLAMNVSTLLAGYVAPLTVLTAGWALSTKKRDFRVVLLGLAGILLIVLILTFSRGGLLSILTAGGIVLVLRLFQSNGLQQQNRIRMVLGAAVIAGMVLASLYTIVSITRARSNDAGDAGRLDMWQSALEMTRDHPLTGIGVGVFGRVFREYRDPSIAQDKLASAHNAYLNAAAENGLLGVAAGLWLVIVFIRTWYGNWRHAETPMHKMRLEITFAALVGMGVHSLVDVFTVTPIVLMILLLAAYCVASTSQVTIQAKENRLLYRIPGIALLAGVLVYGFWLIQIDRAQARYMASFSDEISPITKVSEAEQLDPSLTLYPLQAAYLSGQAGTSDESINAYQEALVLEPIWDVGWINLAGLELRANNPTEALEYLDRARQINYANSAGVRWAELAETLKAAPDDAIIDAYVIAMENSLFLPLSSYWQATELRKAALEKFLTDLPLDQQYRILVTIDPQRAYALVPAENEGLSAAQWWVQGEYALTVENDPARAVSAFSEAIRLAPNIGDYYASRGRATLQTDPESAERDLKIALLLGTTSEYPNALLATLATTTEAAYDFRVNALPGQPIPQEFAAVLYNRPATFDVFPELGRIGPGHTAMLPWYQIAEERQQNGNTEGAIRAYRAILNYAPDEEEARTACEAIGGC